MPTLEPPPPTTASEALQPIWLPLYPGESPHHPRGPSARNREIYYAVRVERRRQTDVARELHLTPARVCQILAQVERWIGVTRGRTRKDETAVQRLAVAEYLHRERLDHLYGSALDGWRKSQEDQRTTKVVRGKGEEQRTGAFQSSPGNPRFLLAALAIQEKQWRFAAEIAETAPVERMTVEERTATVEEIVQEVGRKNDESSEAAEQTGTATEIATEAPPEIAQAPPPPCEAVAVPPEAVVAEQSPAVAPDAQAAAPAPRSSFPRIIIHRGDPPPLEPPTRIVIQPSKRICATPGLPTKPPERRFPARGSRTAAAMPPRMVVKRAGAPPTGANKPPAGA